MPRALIRTLFLALICSSISRADLDLTSQPALRNLGTLMTADTAAPDLNEPVAPQHPPQQSSPSESETLLPSAPEMESAPVVIAGDTLFFIYGHFGPFTPFERARKVADRIEILINSRYYVNTPVSLQEGISATEIVAGDLVIHSITNQDARIMGGLRQELAAAGAQTIQQVVERERARRSPRLLVLGILFTAAATIGLLAAWRGTTALAYRIKDRLAGRHVLSFSPYAPPGQTSFLDRRSDRVIIAVKSVRILVQLCLLYTYLTIVTGFFYTTQGVHVSMYRQLQVIVDWAGSNFVGFLPQLFIIATILTVTYIVVQFVRLIFVGLGRGTIRWPGFHPEWAQPTYRIVSLVLTLFAIVMLWPHLPGSKSPAFMGLTIAFGAIVVLGSVVAAANWIAGLVIGYSLPFRVGDYVQIAGTTGEVVGWTLFATRLRTAKNVDVTIPNALALTGHIVNFSRPGPERNLILHMSVTLGSEVPWARAHELLIEAALRTPAVLKDPLPFVTQRKVSSEGVVYELNMQTNEPAQADKIQSNLHLNLLELLTAAGITILAASYGRDADADNGSEGEYLTGTGSPQRFHIFPPLRRMFHRHPKDSPTKENLPD